MDPRPIDIVESRTVGPDMIALELESPAGFTAKPGQFILVRGPPEDAGATDRDIRVQEAEGRHYTISSPDTIDTFEITIEVGPEGTVSPWLAGRNPGDTIYIEGPFGRTYYDGGDVAVIAGGPGTGAAVGIGERAIKTGHGAGMILQPPLAHEQRLAKLAIAGATGFIVTTRLADAVEVTVDAPRTLVFGFREFIDQVRATLERIGADPDSVDYENFGPR